MGRALSRFDPRDASRLGPAMSRLTVRQRTFVDALLMAGDTNYRRAAIVAGYSEDSPNGIAAQATRLAHDERIIKAISEETDRRLQAGSAMAASVLLGIANDVTKEPKDRMKAAFGILDRTGHSAVSVSQVTHQHVMNEEEMIGKIRNLAILMQLDPKKLLGNQKVIEAEAVDVTPSDDGLEDVL